MELQIEKHILLSSATGIISRQGPPSKASPWGPCPLEQLSLRSGSDWITHSKDRIVIKSSSWGGRWADWKQHYRSTSFTRLTRPTSNFSTKRQFLDQQTIFRPTENSRKPTENRTTENQQKILCSSSVVCIRLGWISGFVSWDSLIPTSLPWPLKISAIFNWSGWYRYLILH